MNNRASILRIVRKLRGMFMPWIVSRAAGCALTTLALLVICGCKPKVNDFSQFVNIPSQGWPYGNEIEFKPEIADSAATGQLVLSLRHSNSYLYSNLWLEIVVSDSLAVTTDTIGLTLADQSGRWYGKGIATDFEVVDTISPDISLARNSVIKLRHIMRDDLLEGIEHVGLIFTEGK